MSDINKTINFGDGSKLEVSAAAGEEAKQAYFTHIRPIINRIEMEVAHQLQGCCDSLRDALNDQSRYPVLTHIPPTQWQTRHLGEQYHGADGPGYYLIYRLEGTDRTTYVRLTACPFCEADLIGVTEDSEVYEDDLSPGDL